MNKKILSLIEKRELNDNELNNLSSGEVIKLLKALVQENDKPSFNKVMMKCVAPDIFWDVNKYLVKENNYDFLIELINCYKKIENDNQYIDSLLFDFIEKDDLYFVDYLVNIEKSSTESMQENEVTVLNECVKSNAIKCFDYFLSKGKDVKEFDDLVFFTILEERKYEFIPLFLEENFNLNEDIAKNFFRYGLKNNQESISKKDLDKLIKFCENLIDNNKILQNKLTLELLNKNNFKQLEKNFEKGYSISGDQNEIMEYAINLKKNASKAIKLLLDYGGYFSEEQIAKLTNEEKQEIKEYPRFSKLNKKLYEKLDVKTKIKSVKI